MFEPDNPALEGYITEERGEELFRGGLQAARERLAQFIEQDLDFRDRDVIARMLRETWNPSWGPDPGRPKYIAENAWDIP